MKRTNLLRVSIFITIVLAIVSTLTVGVLGKKILALYLAEKTLRLDPLQLNYRNYLSPIDLAIKSSSIRVVFFGDSRAEAWTAPRLHGYHFYNRGIGDQSTKQVLGRMPYHLKDDEYDVVVIQVGINDLKLIPLMADQKHWIVSSVKTNLTSIISNLSQKNKTVIVSTIFPIAEKSYYNFSFFKEPIKESIAEINQWILTLDYQNVVILDLASHLAGDNGTLRSKFAIDRLHLNSAGYEAINEELKHLLTAVRFKN